MILYNKRLQKMTDYNLDDMDNKELANLIESMDEWDGDLNKYAANRVDLLEEYKNSDADTFEDVMDLVLDKLRG